MQAVIVDTDIGTNLDDALALAYLLRQPRAELLGVSTVGSQPEVRARLARALCRSAARSDVPVAAGAGEPLGGPPWTTEVPQAEALPDSPDPAAPPAVELLARTLRSRPGECVLLAVGPLTNLATLFRLDPGAASRLGRLVLMGGLYRGRVAGRGPVETNLAADPLAAAEVFTAGVPELLAVGLEVTTRCVLEAPEARARLAGAGLDFLEGLADEWLRRAPRVVFHDPLAAALAFLPELGRSAPGRIRVDLEGPPETLGKTFWEPGEGGPHRIVTEVDPAAFFEHYFDVLRSERS